MLARRDLQGIRVLLIEDESLLCLMFEDILAELGCRVAGVASNLKQAFDIVHARDDIDVALLDVKLGEQSVFPVASELVKRGVPMVFSTGMGVEGLPSEWQAYPVIPKPATIGVVAAGLDQALEAAWRRKQEAGSLPALLDGK